MTPVALVWSAQTNDAALVGLGAHLGRAGGGEKTTSPVSHAHHMECRDCFSRLQDFNQP